MSKPRKVSDTEILARWFYCDILKQEWDYRLASRYLGEAKHLVNPKEGAEPISIPVIKGTIQFMVEGRWDDWDRPVTSLRMVMWGQPPFYKRYQEWMTNPPPAYLQSDVKEWEEVTGKIAYPEGAYDIIQARPQAAPDN